MKKIYILFAFTLLTIFSKATVHQIAVLSTTFSPASLSAVCGDTIVWNLANITQSHTTTSVSVPSGASGWGANLNSTATSYTLALTVAGTYSYICTFHVSMGMAGNITVTCPSGVPAVNSNYLSAAYPMPFTSKLTIETTQADMIALYNIFGEKIKTIVISAGETKTEVNTADLGDGIYFYCILKEGVMLETRKIIKN